MLSTCHSCQIFNETWNFLNRFSENTQLSTFMKTQPVGAKLFKLDGLTDMMNLTVAFHNSVNTPKNFNI